MAHLIAAAILTLGILSPIFWSFIVSWGSICDKEEMRNLFFNWLSMVSGCILTVVLSALFYCIS